jgi:hypothetical protein
VNGLAQRSIRCQDYQRDSILQHHEPSPAHDEVNTLFGLWRCEFAQEGTVGRTEDLAGTLRLDVDLIVGHRDTAHTDTPNMLFVHVDAETHRCWPGQVEDCQNEGRRRSLSEHEDPTILKHQRVNIPLAEKSVPSGDGAVSS